MKKTTLLTLITIVAILFMGCGGNKTQASADNKLQEHIKQGVTQFVKHVEDETHLSSPLHEYLTQSSTYTLTINKSNNGVYFYLAFSSPSQLSSFNNKNTTIKISVSGNTITVEGFYANTLKDVANIIFSEDDTQWIKELVYDKVSIIQCGYQLPHNAKYFVLFSNESPWDTYVSLHYLNVAPEEPTKQEDGTYILKLKDDTVYLKEVDGGTDIYK